MANLLASEPRQLEWGDHMSCLLLPSALEIREFGIAYGLESSITYESDLQHFYSGTIVNIYVHKEYSEFLFSQRKILHRLCIYTLICCLGNENSGRNMQLLMEGFLNLDRDGNLQVKFDNHSEDSSRMSLKVFHSTTQVVL